MQRQQWIHNGERPHPCITQQLRALERGPASHSTVGLRNAAGQLVCHGSGPANVAITQWAAFSNQPQVDQAAQQEVLAAV